jgi:putative tryptophan/tyrosine transport system substrate-binding protein
MRRREFIAALGGTAAMPLVARAQQPTRKIVKLGFLQAFRNENTVAFVEGLRSAGYVDGQNALLEARFYGSIPDRILEVANELVSLQCDVIIATGPHAIQAAMSATSVVPIVGVDLESDPVAKGWATSLARPGKNLTGWFLDLPELGGKQIELLKEAVPKLSTVGVLWDSTVGEVQFRATESASIGAGVKFQSLPIQRAEELEAAFDRAVRERVQGMVVLSSPLILGQRAKIADLALKVGLPTISLFTLFPASGALMAYGPDLADLVRRAGTYIDRILKGAKAGELPIERPSKFSLVINLKTAKALGLEIPPSLLARADEVIE